MQQLAIFVNCEVNDLSVRMLDNMLLLPVSCKSTCEPWVCYARCCYAAHLVHGIV